MTRDWYDRWPGTPDVTGHSNWQTDWREDPTGELELQRRRDIDRRNLERVRRVTEASRRTRREGRLVVLLRRVARALGRF